MGQIITSLINFFLEVGKSGHNYRTPRNKGKAVQILIFAALGLMSYISYQGFTTAYLSRSEVVKLKAEIIELSSMRKENESLKVRNEILSTTLSHYIGLPLVNKLNSNDKSGLNTLLVKPEQQNP